MGRRSGRDPVRRRGAERRPGRRGRRRRHRVPAERRRLQRRARHQHPLPRGDDRQSARRRRAPRPCCRWATRSTGTPRSRLRRVVRPDVGPVQPDRPSRRRGRGVRDRGGVLVLRLLRLLGRAAGGRLLQLRRRRLASHRPQLGVRRCAVRAGLRAGVLAAKRPRRPPEPLHARLLAPAALHVGPRRPGAGDGLILAGPVRGRRRGGPERPQPPVRAFAAQAPDRAADPVRGIRQFVVGTGGDSLAPLGDDLRANSEARITGVFGVLLLTLRPDGYGWRFVEAGGTVRDAGSQACH